MSLKLWRPKKLELNDQLRLQEALGQTPKTGGSGPPPPPTNTFHIGLNLSGGQEAFPSFVPLAELQYLNSYGFSKYRLPTSWARVNQNNVQNGFQLVPFGSINEQYAVQIDTILSQMAGLGASTLLDLHEFGAGPGPSGPFSITALTSSGTTASATYSGASAPLVNDTFVNVTGAASFPPNNYNGNYQIFNVTGTTFQYTLPNAQGSTTAGVAGAGIKGLEFISIGSSSRLPPSAFADLWGKLSLRYNGNPGIRGYDLMNEWPNGFDSSIIFDASQQAINAIRANGDNTPIYIEGTNYSSAWNWATGQGQPFSSNLLYQLVDPMDNLFFSAHMYMDWDDSGTHFGYFANTQIAGAAPPGLNTSPDIGVQRITDFLAWCTEHGVRGHLGECGASNDQLISGGLLNWAAWNTSLKNTIDLCKANNVEYCYWGAGPDFGPLYPSCPEPASQSNPSVKVFSQTGVQATMMSLLQGYTDTVLSTQPTAYSLTLPQTITATGNPFAPIVTPAAFGSVGVASSNFTVYYGGVISSTVTITPHSLLMDGTSGGGTFTPSSVTLPPGVNGQAFFTYTPSQTGTFRISATNNAGWSDPPEQGYACGNDLFASASNKSNMVAFRRIIGNYIGSAIRVLSPVDNVSQQDFFFNNRGDLPRQAIQDFCGGTRIAQVTRIYNQTGNTAGDFIPKLANNPFFVSVFQPILGCANNGSGLIRVTLPGTGEYLSTGSKVSIAGVGGTTEANSSLWTVTVINTTQIDLQGSTFVHAYTSGGTINPINSCPTIDLTNTDGYPETLAPSGADKWMGAEASSVNQGLLTLLARVNGASGPFIDQENFSAQFRLSTSSFIAGQNGSPSTSVSLGTNTGYHTIAGTYSNLYTVGNANGYVDGSSVATVNAPQFTFQPSNGDQDTFINGFRFGGQNFVGAWQEVVITFDELSSGALAAIATDNAAYYATPLPDSLTAAVPEVLGAVPSNIITESNPFIGITIQDTNISPTDSITITLTGTAGGTLSGTGISGTGPYTISADTPANVTTTLRGALYSTSGTATQTETFSIHVVSSAGTSVTNTQCVVTVLAIAPAETPYAAPVGTFTPINKLGVNIEGGQFTYPATTGFNYCYPQSPEVNFWSLQGAGCIRMPVLIRRLQPASYGPLDPPNRTDEPANGYQVWPAGSQTNLLTIKGVLDQAFSLNMYVIIDCHQFGQVPDTFTNTTILPGISSEANNQFADWWTRIATVFKNYPNVIWGLMNEPNGITAAQWFNGAQAGINAIAAVTTTQPVLIPGTFFQNAYAWTSDGNAAAWAAYTPPSGLPIIFDVHQYLDNVGNTANVAQYYGATCLNVSVSGLVTDWARANGYTCMLTEGGWPHPDASASPPGVPSTEGTSLLNFMRLNSDVWSGWTLWQGGSYIFVQGDTYFVGQTGTWGNYPTGPFTPSAQLPIVKTFLTANTTFDPVNVSSGVTLSGGNLVATAATGASSHFARSLRAAVSNYGKFFFSGTATVMDSGTSVGLGLAATISQASLGLDTKSVGYFPSGIVKLNNATIATIQTFTTGDVVDTAVNFGTGTVGSELIWFRVNGGNWNNSGTANPATNTGGISISSLIYGPYYAYVCPGNSAANTSWTSNFGATSYPHAAPAGFANM